MALHLFIPHIYVSSIFDLDLAGVGRQGIKGLILDLDNTLVQWNFPEPPQRVRDWFKELRERGFRACIVSNNTASRVQTFTAPLGVPSIHKAVKPRRSAFRRAMSVMGTGPDDTAVIGDQVLTDIFGGRRLGLLTILVDPLEPREFLGTRLVRIAERAWLGYLSRRGYLEGLGRAR